MSQPPAGCFGRRREKTQQYDKTNKPKKSSGSGSGGRVLLNRVSGRSLHSSTFWVNVSAFCGIVGGD